MGGFQSNLYFPLALKLHAHGLFRLQDSEWCGTELYDRAKRPYRGRVEPRTLFQEPLPNGFLLQLGIWLFEEYFSPYESIPYESNFLRNRTIEFWCEYMEDFRQVLLYSGVPPSDPLLEQADTLLKHVNDLYEQNEDAFYLAAGKNKRTLRKLLERFHESFEEKLREIRLCYARDYAERVFHDRQLCGYISHLILDIGIDGTVDDEPPGQWCPRLTFPAWVRTSLLARERGKCAICETDLAMELRDSAHIDHIVPLSIGGCNDLVNLQILCERCNLAKSTAALPVKSSIPPYLERALRRRRPKLRS